MPVAPRASPTAAAVTVLAVTITQRAGRAASVDGQRAVLGLAGEHEDPGDRRQHGHERERVDEQFRGGERRVGGRGGQAPGDEALRSPP
jgi:hypothetical protein